MLSGEPQLGLAASNASITLLCEPIQYPASRYFQFNLARLGHDVGTFFLCNLVSFG